MATPLLASLYLAPVGYYALLAGNETACIDLHEHFVKQTWRNRCRIAGPNGLQDLIIPLEKYPNHSPAGSIRISYREPWQRGHWRSIKTAYGNSAFFEFYADYFAPFYESKSTTLLCEWNRQLLERTLRLLKINCTISYTGQYNKTAETDFREIISPKNSFPVRTANYPQVFAERHGFRENLSIIDLLCCTGPDSMNYLKQTAAALK